VPSSEILSNSSVDEYSNYLRQDYYSGVDRWPGFRVQPVVLVGTVLAGTLSRTWAAEVAVSLSGKLSCGFIVPRVT